MLTPSILQMGKVIYNKKVMLGARKQSTKFESLLMSHLSSISLKKGILR